MTKNILLALALLAAVSAHAADVGTTLKASSISTEPYGDAKAAGTIERGEKVEILDKRGAWLKVKARQVTGWVRLLTVKRGESAKTNEAAGVLGLASGRSGGNKQVVATLGIRGLSEEDLKSAKFNADEIARLEAAGVSADAARQFALAGNLQARKLDYLPGSTAATESNSPQGFIK